MNHRPWWFVALISACSSSSSTPGDAGGVDATIAPPPPDAGTPDGGFMTPAEVCPRAAADPIFADINGDGVVDIADPIAFQNYFFRGGPEPICPAAADFNDDGLVEADDATRILSFAAPGTQPGRTLSRGACPADVRWPEGQCAPVAFYIGAPSRVSTARFSAWLAIQNPALEKIQGWSLSVTAAGCEIIRATNEGTIGAEVWDEPPGIRHLGYSATTTVAGGAITFVDLSFVEDIYLPRAEAPQPVMVLELSAAPPATGCTPCTISAGGDLAWLGPPISSAIAADGYSYVPELPIATIEVCGGER